MIDSNYWVRKMKCTICLELLYKPRSLDSCGHSFCVFCVERIKEKNCPLCRTSYSKTFNCFEFSKLIQDKFPVEWKTKENDEVRLKLFKEITNFRFPKKVVLEENFENRNSGVLTTTEVRRVNGYEIKPGADLRGANLCHADLRGANLRGANLRYANLRYADLCCADLRDANLYCAYLRAANLSGADLRGANLTGANLRDADLRYADLCDADLRDADLRGVDLRGVDLSDANLSDADLRDADFTGADLRDADLSGANLDRVIGL